MIGIAGLTITTHMVWEVIIFGVVSMLQPWSRSLKVGGVMIGMGAYATIPFVFVGA